MSNYLTKGKRKEEDEWEDVYMVDDFYGSREYGVIFPNRDTYREEDVIINKHYGK